MFSILSQLFLIWGCIFKLWKSTFISNCLITNSLSDLFPVSCVSLPLVTIYHSRRICESSVSRHLQRLFPLLAMDPPYSVSDWLTLGSKPAPVRAVSYFLYAAKRTKNTLSVLIVQIRIRYHLRLQRVHFYFCIVIITTK